MAFNTFIKENNTVEQAENLLIGISPDDDLYPHYLKLLNDYKKLLKTSKRLIRLSDRNESKIRETSRELDSRNQLLTDLSEKLSKYLSPQVYQSIFSGEQDGSLLTKRKKLTVFFSDIVNFTETSENLEPEELTFIINDYLTEMSIIALDFGATIDKFIGDAILLFFGDPTSKGVKEDATHCVLMAIEMQRKMLDLRCKWRNMGFEYPFEVRMGINTGYCNVGNFGSSERMDYTIIGGEVNLASRLESIANTGGIMLSFETYALVRNKVYAEEREPIKVKGIQRKIRPFAVVGLYDELANDQRYIHREEPGLLLLLDLQKITGASRQLILKELEETIKTIRKHDESS